MGSVEQWLFLKQAALPPAWNMACDEWLLLNNKKFGYPILRTYEWDRPSITIGYFQEYPTSLEEKHTIIRRPTGGALVYHDSDLTFSVVLPQNHPWKRLPTEERYRKIHERIRKIFENRGENAELVSPAVADYNFQGRGDSPNRPKNDKDGRSGMIAPTTSSNIHLPTPSGRSFLHDQCFIKNTRYDVLIGTQKVAGGAQRSTRDGLLHQGSIQGGRQPRVSSDELRLTWESFGISFSDAKLSDDDFEGIRDLSGQKYQSPHWNRKVCSVS
jgi:lipoate-protein ligase A